MPSKKPSRRPLKSWHLKRLYNHLNKRWFGARLPSNTAVYFKPNPGKLGLTWYIPVDGLPAAIEIAPLLRRVGWDVVAMTLLHEMVHLDVMRRFGAAHNHGGKFRQGMRDLASAGAFDRYW